MAKANSLKNEQEYNKYLKSIKTFKRSPANFNPLKATKKELAIYGYPRKPNQKTETHLFNLWERAFSGQLKYITPQFEIADNMLNRKSLKVDKSTQQRFGPSGWGGIGVRTEDYFFSPAEPANMVYGEWVIPFMRPDYNNFNTPMGVAIWVGLDGTNKHSDQLLQAGVVIMGNGNGFDCKVWFEWYPDPPVYISNFPVKMGDSIHVMVCANPLSAGTNGFVQILNNSTKATTSFNIPANKNQVSAGATVEWMTERITPDLADFTAVIFQNCAAGTQSNIINLSHPREMIIEGLSKALTQSLSIKDLNYILVRWRGFR